MAKRTQALENAKQRREKLVAQAMANGYTAHTRVKTSTLQKMTNGTYKSKPEQKRVRREIPQL